MFIIKTRLWQTADNCDQKNFNFFTVSTDNLIIVHNFKHLILRKIFQLANYFVTRIRSVITWDQI